MTSQALLIWRTDRQSRLDKLFSAHYTLGGKGRGRRWTTEQINWALVLLLAAEFQGFARDLHDEAGDFFVRQAAEGNVVLESVIKRQIRHGRKLDHGNAQPASLGADFELLGLLLWAALKIRCPNMAKKWHKNLVRLNETRNALAHSHAVAIRNLMVNLDIIRSWRKSMDGLARKMDDVVAEYLRGLFGEIDPWNLERS